MKIVCLFGQRKYDPEIIELMVAWDEYCVDSNVEGWDKVCEDAKKSWGDDLLTHKIVEIQISEDHLRRQFRITELAGEIVDG